MGVLSFPGPVPPVTAKILAENKRIVARDYRNRRVGDFLKELHLTEGRGTGIPTIYRAMENNESPEPIIETDDQCTYFLTVLPVNNSFIDVEVLGKLCGKQVVTGGVQDGVQDSVQGGVQDGDQERSVLKYCLQPRSREEVLKSLGLSNHNKNYKKHIEPLLEKGFLERTLPDKPTSKNQKYVTTGKGKGLICKK